MALANKRFPYNDVADDRRFEELIYAIFKSEISNDGFDGYDDIGLMPGSHDLGRDCALFKSGKNYGVIQCKMYKDAYTKDQFGKEITKFALYSLLYPELIHDTSDFIYYIAVSYGLDRHCLDLLSDFNSRIMSEPALDKWIKANLKLPKLNLLALQDVRPKILAILEKIKVKELNPILLDSLLIKAQNQPLIPLFFEVRTIGLNDTSRLSEADIRSALKIASIAVDSQKNEFEGIPDSHIPRQETQALLQWLKTDAPKDRQDRPENICLLAGNPGMGKTVVIKDVYAALLEDNIPVLAFKADQVYASSLKGLEDQIGMQTPLHDFIKQCKAYFPKIVLLIDQIDALSQSMSADRSLLNTYTQLIANYKYDESVRIVISVRLFDLYYDSSLKLYRNLKVFEMKKLDLQAVIDQLQKLGVSRDRVSDSLQELLRTPNHLDIFSRIYTGQTHFAGINSIVDLYNELWALKVLGRGERLPELIYEIAEEMYATQQITVGELKFELDANDLRYLKAERIVKSEERGLQFLHQSFYDYAFAKRFVHRGESLPDFLIREEQSIFVRSALKMIVSHLRAFDVSTYIAQLSGLLISKRYYFHIHHLLISFIAVQDSPLTEEKRLATSLILTNTNFAQVFFDQAFGKKWIDFLLDGGYLTKLTDADLPDWRFSWKKKKSATKNENLTTLFHLLRKNLNQSPDKILDFLNGLDDWKFFGRLLYGLEDWSNKKALIVLDRLEAEDSERETVFYGLLERVAESNPNYVFEKVRKNFLAKHDQSDRHIQHRESGILEMLFEKIPLELCEYAIDFIEKELPGKILHDYDKPLLHDYFIGGFDLQDDDSNQHTESFYKLFAKQMHKYAAEKASIFINYQKENGKSPYRSKIKLLIYCLLGNESLYANEIFNLIFYLNDERVFESQGRLSYDIRQLVRAVYPYLLLTQQQDILAMIKNLRVPNEHIKWLQDNKKTHSIWGLTKLYFLQSLPEEAIGTDLVLNKIYEELIRRHGNITETRPHVGILGGGVSPHKQKAYSNMNEQNWISSFKKYDRSYDSFSHRNNGKTFGGMHEHADAFKRAVTAEPDKLVNIVRKIVSDSAIDFDYALSGIEGLVLGTYKSAEILSLFKQLIKREQPQSTILVMYLAEKISDKDNYDSEILDYIIWQALNNKDPEQTELKSYINEPKNSLDRFIQRGIGTHRGYAAHLLVHVADKRFEDRIFEVIESVFERDNLTVRAAALYQFAFLMNLNGKRAFDLYLKIVSDKKNEEILTCSLWSLQYLINYDFKRLIPHLKQLSVSPDLLAEDTSWLSTILFAACLHGYKGAEKLYVDFIAKHPESWQHAAHDAIKHFYKEDKVSKTSYWLLKYVFSAKRTAKVKAADFHIYDLDMIKFKDISLLLKIYVRSPLYVLRESFIEHLTSNAGRDPLTCIHLFGKAIGHEAKDGNDFFGHEDLATKFILGAYTSLQPRHKRYKRRLLKAFDKVLTDVRFKNNADNILEKVLS